jgi:hypothetical protein
MQYGCVYVASKSRQIAGNKNFAATSLSNSRQIGNKPFSSNRSVKLASNSSQIGNKTFSSNRSVKFALNLRQIGSKPFSSNRPVKLASNAYMQFQLNFIYEYMIIHVNIHTYMQICNYIGLYTYKSSKYTCIFM